ncbi:DUF2213 domain-containing protein [Xanthomonas translucens]|uniref:DUF2213 domain-containing protein n=1 Tax=Xanthomonas campestris pv. translucens TaxID=343 RepID=UPI00071E71EB|nr:DUF2213 domain-containing protein [Xanthomonas translucens]QEN93639.1 DUF2213 domain-containing protein [Xanthomonas translucens pv. undulosa]QSQ58047.1 DUF2213 domain-containing protein [Xanthomonas translucens pv. undulosa]
MFLTDRVSVSAPRRTADGYLVADAKVARTGVQEYLGSELGRPDMPVVRLYRPAEEVFATDAMHSYAFRPITVEHPDKMVDASTWKAVSAGQTGAEVVRDGEFVRVPLVLMDAAAITAYQSGKRELSMGYTAEIVFRDGIAPDGQAYDAVQTDLRMNHLALVDRARGGQQLRIGDGRTPGDQDRGATNPQPEKSTMSNTNTRTVMVDGLSVETTDAGAQAITKLQQQLSDAATASARQTSDHTAALALKDAEIAKRDATIDDLKTKVLTDAALDERVQARGDLVATAKAIHDADYRCKSDAEVRKAAVVGKLGDAAVAGKADAYIEARFDILADSVKGTDPVARALRDGVSQRTTVQDNGYAASVAGLDYRTRNQKEA